MRLVGKGDTVKRLSGNLQADPAKRGRCKAADSAQYPPFSFEARVANKFLVLSAK